MIKEETKELKINAKSINTLYQVYRRHCISNGLRRIMNKLILSLTNAFQKFIRIKLEENQNIYDRK